MTARVLVGCLFQEGSTFAVGRTTRAAFEVAGVLEGAASCREHVPAGKELAAAWDVIEAAGHEVVPGLFAWAPPGPPIDRATFESLAEPLVRCADTSIDGVYLQLHGSMVVEGLDDAEGELLRRIRARLRPGVPIAASFDLHATMTPAMVASLDIITAYGTCPHVDLARTGEQAGRLLISTLDGRIRPVVGWAPIAMTTPPARHDDTFPPFKALMDACRHLEQRPGILAAALLPSQPWMDVPDLGWSAVVVADDDASRAHAAARELATFAWEQRDAFLTAHLVPVTEALALALQGPPPFVLADAGDATNGGAPGDSTELLRAALGHTERRILLTITDAAAARILRGTPIGTETSVTLGSGGPDTYHAATRVQGIVLAHPEGTFRYSHPFSAGLPGDLGTCAVLGIGAVRVVVHERPVGLIDPEPYLAAGLDPSSAEVLQAKSHISYVAGFAHLTGRSVVAATPGPTTADLASLPWRRRSRPLWPFEEPPSPWRAPGAPAAGPGQAVSVRAVRGPTPAPS